MGLVQTEAIILGTKRLGESDKLITLFSQARGKIRAVANGARKPRGRFGGSVEPFVRSQFVLFEQRPGSLLRIRHCTIIESYPVIRTTLEYIMAAGRMVQLISLLTPMDEKNLKIYGLLLDGLGRIRDSRLDLDLLLRFFEIQLLNFSGYLPKVDQCLRCQDAVLSPPVYFSAEAGGILCQKCHTRGHVLGRSISKGTVAMIDQTRRLGWAKIDRLKATLHVRGELRALLESSLSQAVGQPLAQKLLIPDI